MPALTSRRLYSYTSVFMPLPWHEWQMCTCVMLSPADQAVHLFPAHTWTAQESQAAYKGSLVHQSTLFLTCVLLLYRVCAAPILHDTNAAEWAGC